MLNKNYNLKIDDDILQFAKKHNINTDEMRNLIESHLSGIIQDIEKYDIHISSPEEWGIPAKLGEYECIVSICKEDGIYNIKLVDIYIMHEEDDEEAQKIVDAIIKE